MAAFREARRVRNEGVAAGWLPADDPALVTAELRQMIGGPEHNWGLCTGCYLPGFTGPNGNWSNTEFHPLINRPDYAFVESGWAEKRGFLSPATPPGVNESLAFKRYVAEAAAAVAALTPQPPNLSGWQLVPAGSEGANWTCGEYTWAINATTGAVAGLWHAPTGNAWIGAGSPGYGSVRYRTYTEADFDRWNEEYNPGCGPPCGDFAKWGMDSAGPVSQVWPATLSQLWRATGDGVSVCQLRSLVTLPAETGVKYGGAAAYWLTFSLAPQAAGDDAFVLGVELDWFNKTATRLAEALFVSFVPLGTGNDSAWSMDVLGSGVNPLDVVSNGGRHLHGVTQAGVTYSGGGNPGDVALWQLAPLFTPVIAPGDIDHLLWYDGTTLPALAGGWHSVVHSNMWNTAFPLWYGQDGRAVWVVRASAS